MFTKKTKLGKLMRAVANDPNLASASGVNSNWILLWVFIIGSCLAGIAGILISLDVDITPIMGMNVLLYAIVAVILFKKPDLLTVALGALLLSFAQNVAAWYLGSQWMNSVAFIILLFYLMLKTVSWKRIQNEFGG